MIIDRAAFIRANTSVMRPPLVPEISLHLAHEAVPLWQKTEEELGALGLPPPFWAFAWAGGQALARAFGRKLSVVTRLAGAGQGLAQPGPAAPARSPQAPPRLPRPADNHAGNRALAARDGRCGPPDK